MAAVRVHQRQHLRIRRPAFCPARHRRFRGRACHPCKQLDPIVEELAGDWQGKVRVLKLDIDQNLDTTMKYGVMGVPTLILFVGGGAREWSAPDSSPRAIREKLAGHLRLQADLPRTVDPRRAGDCSPLHRPGTVLRSRRAPDAPASCRRRMTPSGSGEWRAVAGAQPRSTPLAHSSSSGKGDSRSNGSARLRIDAKSEEHQGSRWTHSRTILTGDRPTGPMHLGHYVGTLANRIRLQDSYECFFIVADLHTLTTRPDKADIARIEDNVREMMLDYLAVGIDPERSAIFLQSAVPETFELNLLLEMLVSVPRLERVPSLKEMAQAAHLSTMPFGLLGYPVLQAADILLPRATLVPVGKDNAAHVEVAREIARRFNSLYGDVFPVPDVLLGDIPMLVGTDGQEKMSKSLDNAIFLSDDARQVEARVRGCTPTHNASAPTSPERSKAIPSFPTTMRSTRTAARSRM